MGRTTFARIAGLGAATLLGGCAIPPQVTTARDATHDIAPRRLRGCSAWRTTVAEGWAWEAASAWAGVGRTAWEGALDTARGDAGDAAGDGARSSRTNTQVEGVDEPDTVEADGGWMWVQGDLEGDGRHRVRVVDARDPRALAQAGSLALDGAPRGMLLAPGTLGVLASGDGGIVPWEDGRAPWTPDTTLDLLDVSAPGSLGGGARVEVDGELLDARRVDDTAWVVTRWRLDVPQAVWDAAAGTLWPPDASVDRARGMLYRALLPVAREAVRALPDEALLPEVRVVGLPHGGIARRVPCDGILAPRRPESVTLAVVARVGMDAADPEVAVEGVVTGAHALWMDAGTLVLAESSWARGGATTRVHRLGLAPPTTRRRSPAHVLRAGASAEVSGMVLDRWSLDVWKGDVRVVTTEVGLPEPGGAPRRAPSNRLVVLRADGSRLRAIGAVGDITPGERLMAARFLGDRAFLVTFEVVDPLLAVDLSDPRDPRIVGELEVPGYSSYLHPYGEDRLLAVGMDGTATGGVTGFAVSLYDVSDLSAPARLDLLPYESRWSSSPALWDPHAFLLWEDVLAVPVVGWDAGADRTWSGLSVVQVGADDTLAELGRIDHAHLACDTPADGAMPADPSCAWTDMRRSLVVEGDLYAVSTAGVSAHPLREPGVTLGEVAWDAGAWAGE